MKRPQTIEELIIPLLLGTVIFQLFLCFRIWYSSIAASILTGVITYILVTYVLTKEHLLPDQLWIMAKSSSSLSKATRQSESDVIPTEPVSEYPAPHQGKACPASTSSQSSQEPKSPIENTNMASNRIQDPT